MCPEISCSPWRYHAEVGSWQELLPVKDSCWIRFILKDWDRGKVWEGAAKRSCSRLITTSIPCPPMPLSVREGGRRVRNGVELNQRKGGWWAEGALVFVFVSRHPTVFWLVTMYFFSQVESVLPMVVTDKWSPCLYFSILFYASILLRKRNERVAVWGSGCWPRSKPAESYCLPAKCRWKQSCTHSSYSLLTKLLIPYTWLPIKFPNNSMCNKSRTVYLCYGFINWTYIAATSNF